MKSDKMPYIIYDDMESLKKQMDVQIIQKTFQQKKQVSVFLPDIQCQQFGYLITQNKSILYIT